jgi:hypothetical protein
MHVDQPADLVQPRDLQGRHRRKREDMRRRRKPGFCGLGRTNALQNLDERGAGFQRGRADGGRQALPERGLPALVGGPRSEAPLTAARRPWRQASSQSGR